MLIKIYVLSNNLSLMHHILKVSKLNFPMYNCKQISPLLINHIIVVEKCLNICFHKYYSSVKLKLCKLLHNYKVL